MKRLKGKALLIKDDTLYFARGYKVFAYKKDADSIAFEGKVIDTKYGPFARLRILARLFRAEIASMIRFDDGTRLVAAKKAIFVAEPGSKRYEKTFTLPRGNKPLNICQTPDGTLYFGEYFLNGRYGDTTRDEVHIYRSDDQGRSWQICYTFKKNTVRHIHGVFYDPYEDAIWVATGDQDHESMIAVTYDRFKSLEVIKKGAQRYRAVSLLFYPDRIVYGTDTEHEKNFIYALERETYRERRLQALQGSVMTALKDPLSDRAVLSTAVEPSSVNTDTKSYVWFSRDGENWREVFSAPKDPLPARYFQYGRITFPAPPFWGEKIVCNGHALKGTDQTAVFIEPKL